MSAWDTIVGIPLDDWQRADTREQVAWLIELRDHPLPEQGPAPELPCTCEQIDIVNVGTGLVTTVPGQRDPGCVKHRRQT